MNYTCIVWCKWGSLRPNCRLSQYGLWGGGVEFCGDVPSVVCLYDPVVEYAVLSLLRFSVYIYVLHVGPR